jgi:hypothetical protein
MIENDTKKRLVQDKRIIIQQFMQQPQKSVQQNSFTPEG